MINEEDKSKKFDPVKVEFIASGMKVVDQEAYAEYQRLEKHIIFNEKKMFHGSDGVIYNIGQIHTKLKERIAHLPQEEQDKILTLKQLYYKISVKRMSAQRKAFGKIVTKNGSGAPGEMSVRHPIEMHSEQVVELFGRMYNLKEVAEICVTKLKFKVSNDVLKAFRVKHAGEIQEKIDLFKRDYSDLRLAIKKGRLEEGIFLYNKMRRKYEITNKNDDHRVLLQTLEYIRKEAEGDSLRLSGDVNINVDLVIQDHIQKEIKSTLPLREIVLARIAGTQNIPVVKFLGQVEKSWYNKYLNSAEEIKFEDIPRPTTQTYNFDEISRIHKQKADQVLLGVQEVEEVPTVAEKQQGQSLKDLLIARIVKQQGEINYAKNEVSGNIQSF